MNKTGIIGVHPKGFGFVTPDDGTKDVFIPKHLTNGAVDKDRVDVFVMQSPKGPEGHVVEILERSRHSLVGLMEGREAYVPMLGKQRRAIVKVKGKKKPRKGDRVLLKVLDWGEGDEPVLTELTKNYGPITDPSIDITIAMEEYQIPPKFPTEVVQEAKKYGKKVSDIKGRIDFRKDEVVTIDPETAKDFDDALSIVKDKNGNYRLNVHIADVTAYVKQGSALDREAYARANSTYFPGNCVPMLPEELSNELCSLKPKVDRLTASVLMEFDGKGHLIGYEIVRGVICSQKRFSYGEARQVIDGKKKSKHKGTLLLMVELCEKLKKLRRGRGSVDLALPETILKIDANGMPTGVKVEEYDITHQMVEEFMLKANEVVASHFLKRDMPGIYRVHEEPQEKNLEDFYNLARLLGFQLRGDPQPKDIQRLFKQAAGTAYGQRLAVAFIRSMKLAIYSPQNIGHYGLCLESYTHFTSPIRRYSDLIVHRLLFDDIEMDNLETLTTHLSEKERVSFRAEMSVLHLKKIRYLKVGKTYRAIISKVTPRGVFFELSPLGLEGFIHISQLGDDYYEWDDMHSILVGADTEEEFFPGLMLEVYLEDIDWTYQETSWSLVDVDVET
ncbi:MAG: Ribonuclease R [Chlamydiia bacterium]|nr:Ribonuclease R [Chlamydiia bacterium]MCH9615798.1 Ribonuclease R [Chlamydiia bacterium]MCH9628799.1 Ribonuclease R [Chlamydiia bacterium]